MTKASCRPFFSQLSRVAVKKRRQQGYFVHRLSVRFLHIDDSQTLKSH